MQTEILRKDTGTIALKDIYGRAFKTLRLSLSHVCNLSCLYCVSEEEEEIAAKKNLPTFAAGNGGAGLGEEDQLTLEEYVASVSVLHQLLDLKTVRLTGGEPLLFRELPELIGELEDLGIPNIRMTTNGYLLKQFIPRVSGSKLGTINISLDALDERVYQEISRRKNLHRILEGIDLTLEAGYNVKINCAVMRGINDSQIMPLLEFARSRGIVIRYLELMKMGHLHQGHHDYFFSEEEILNRIGEKYDFEALPRKVSSTANYWQLEDGSKFGIISNESRPFCHDCNRLRLDCSGRIYGCLSTNEGISIKDSLHDPEQMMRNLQKAMGQKQVLKFRGSSISMKAIGG